MAVMSVRGIPSILMHDQHVEHGGFAILLREPSAVGLAGAGG